MSNLVALARKLENLRQVFDVNKVVELQPDSLYVQKYYKINKIPYSIFHTKTDLMYMSVSRDGMYKEEDLLEQAKVIEEYILKNKAKKVLELATGRGANSSYLAKRHPEATFYGVDISDGQLDFAFKKAKKVQNYFPYKGDYHDLSCFPESSFDVVFEVEALCYSQNKQKVISEVKRVLKPGGFFISFDGYRVNGIENSPLVEQDCYRIMALGMAVKDFGTYEVFQNIISHSGLTVDRQENLSIYILPTLFKFENLAAKFLKYPIWANMITRFLPKVFIYNIISGYLMSDLVKNGTCKYMMTVVKK